MSYKIAMIVHGRFHAFDLTRELLRLGHDVTLFTNYPRPVAGRFGIPKERVRSFLTHGILSRVFFRVLRGRFSGTLERIFNTAFGRWAESQITGIKWDIVIAFSGVAECAFRAVENTATLRCLQRGSSHIREQWRLLVEEEVRAGCWVEKPSQWIVAREEREYAQADMIHVLSTFARESFLKHDVPAPKLYQLWLGVNTTAFRAPAETIEARCRRIMAGEPIRVLSVGTFCQRKGARDLVQAMQMLGNERFTFRLVGPVAKDGRTLRRLGQQWATFVPKQRQQDLPTEYQWGDVFVLPTIEDGFAVVLTQALASGLPLVCSTNCAGPDLIREGEGGWIVPIRSPESLADRLHWFDEHRAELVRMVRQVHQSSLRWDWSQTAQAAIRNFEDAIARKAASGGKPPPAGGLQQVGQGQVTAGSDNTSARSQAMRHGCSLE